MRPILSIAVLAVLGVLTWHALAIVAPGIERRIDSAAEAVASSESPHPLLVTTRGRNLAVSGLADAPAARDALLARLRALPGVEAVEDRISVLPQHDPYRFAARRVHDQPLRIEGDAPNATAERAILDQARAIANGTSLQSALTLAAGAPDPGWAGSVSIGLKALGALADGEIEITGRDGRLAGRAGTDEARTAILAGLAADPVIRWQAAIEILLPHAAPYRFRAETGPEGASFTGNAPNPSVRARLTEAASRLGGGTATGSVSLAEGMPDRAWPRMVTRGLEALAVLDHGSLMVEGADAYLEGIAATPEDAAEALRRAGRGIRTDITVTDPTPAARLVVEVSPDAALPRLVEGRLPDGLDQRALARALPEVGLAGARVETGGRSTPDGWDGVIAALGLALPRLASGRADVEADRIRLEGRLRPGFSAATTRTALRAVTGPGWTLDLALDEAPQPAAVDISLANGQLVANGILPEGLGAEATLVRLHGAETSGLTSGGAGDPLAWRQAIDAIAAASAAFESLDAHLEDTALTLSGTLVQDRSPAEVETAVAAGLAAGWTSDIVARAPPRAAPPPPESALQDGPGVTSAGDARGARRGEAGGVAGPAPDTAPSPRPRRLARAGGPDPDVPRKEAIE